MLDEAEETVLVEREGSADEPDDPDDPEDPEDPRLLDAEEAEDDDAAVVGDLSKKSKLSFASRGIRNRKLNSPNDCTLSSDSSGSLTVARSSGSMRGRSSAILVRVGAQSSINRIYSRRVIRRITIAGFESRIVRAGLVPPTSLCIVCDPSKSRY